MKKYLIMLAAAFVLLFSQGYAQDNSSNQYGSLAMQAENLKKTPEELKSKVSGFFEKVMKDDIDMAFGELLRNSSINENQEQVKALVDETKKSSQVYGTMKGFEPYGAELISSSMIRLKYLALHTEFPMRWIFTYYKSPVNGWLIINVKFDDNTEEVFSGN